MRHAKAVATLLIIQGVAELGVALVLLLSSGTLSGRASDAERGAFLFYYLIAVGILVLPCALAKIAAGVQNRRLCGRTLGYVALLSALPSAITMWCAPTGLVIMAYGLIAYGRPEVKEAFEAGEAAPSGRPLGLGRL